MDILMLYHYLERMEPSNKLNIFLSNIMTIPLHYASRNGYVDAIALLIDHGANINEKDGVGSTPLHGASYQSNIDAIALLRANGAIE